MKIFPFFKIKQKDNIKNSFVYTMRQNYKRVISD